MLLTDSDKEQQFTDYDKHGEESTSWFLFALKI